jgi:RNA polymerase sigma factor (sigma-70 family)
MSISVGSADARRSSLEAMPFEPDTCGGPFTGRMRPVTDLGDRDLVERCLAGEEAAWNALVGRYGDLVFGIARRAGLRDDAAGDVVQEVGVALLRNLRRLRDRDRLFPWVVRTAKREAWRQRRRAKASVRREGRSRRSEVDPGESAEEALRLAEDEQAVREALAAIGESCRRLLRALYFEGEGRGYDEIAERLGIPRGSIGPTRGRCLEKLRGILEERGFAAPDASDVSGEAPGASRGTGAQRS